MATRTSVLVALALIAVAAALPAAQLGAVTPSSPARFQQLAHGQQHAAGQKQRVRGQPGWWHYVAPWWSPPSHAKTKSPPDWVEELPEYKNYAHPPKDTMGVYIPYGRDAMSWVETGATVHSTAKAKSQTKAKAQAQVKARGKAEMDPSLYGMNLNFRDLAEMRMINQLTSPDYNPNAAYAAGQTPPSAMGGVGALSPASLVPQPLPIPMPPPEPSSSALAAPPPTPSMVASLPPTVTSAAAMGSAFMPFLDVDYSLPSLPPSSLAPMPIDSMRMQQQPMMMPLQMQQQMQMQQQQQQQQQQQMAAYGYPAGAAAEEQQEGAVYETRELPHEHDEDGMPQAQDDEEDAAADLDEDEQAEAAADDQAVAQAEASDGDDEAEEQDEEADEQQQHQQQQRQRRPGRRPNLRSRDSSFDARIWRGENDREAQEDYDAQLAELDEVV